MELNKLKEIAKYAAHRTAPENFSVVNVDKAFADGMKEMTRSVNEFMRNKYDIFNIILEQQIM